MTTVRTRRLLYAGLAFLFVCCAKERAAPDRAAMEESVAVPSPGHGFLETALRLQVAGPPDWATNLERYLHGPLAADE